MGIPEVYFMAIADDLAAKRTATRIAELRALCPAVAGK
jgi:hypothetical protein